MFARSPSYPFPAWIAWRSGSSPGQPVLHSQDLTQQEPLHLPWRAGAQVPCRSCSWRPPQRGSWSMLCKDRLGYTGAQAPTERSLQKLQTHSYAHTEIFDITLLACFVNSVTKNMRGSYTKCQSSRKLRPELENSLVRCKHGNEPMQLHDMDCTSDHALRKPKTCKPAKQDMETTPAMPRVKIKEPDYLLRSA